MFENPIVSPSVLSADFMHLYDEVALVEQAGADWVHFDVIDGVFAPNLTVGVPVLKRLRAATRLPIDVHLMITDPLSKLPWFLDHAPDYVTIHWEALGEGDEEEQSAQAVDAIHAAGSKAGIALKPDTPTSVLDTTLGLWDMVLVMSVFPGFSGQSYIPESAERVRSVVAACEARGASPLVQVDGGMDSETVTYVAAFGADVFVAGNGVFAQDDYAAAIDAIKTSALSACSLRGEA